MSFTFHSIGPKGIIRKVVNYQSLNWYLNSLPVINLAFGDWNEECNKVDDSVVSNNADRNKILATVASTVLLYLDKHGPCFIFATGVTPAKTRLYQMSINAYRQEIESIFMVMGLYKKEWIAFEPGRNYDAFLILKK